MAQNFNVETKKKDDKKKAVALVYEPGNEAPQKSDVPLYKDTDLTNTLLNLDIGECIPPELYGVVAEILVYVDRMDKLRAKLGK